MPPSPEGVMTSWCVTRIQRLSYSSRRRRCQGPRLPVAAGLRRATTSSLCSQDKLAIERSVTAVLEAHDRREVLAAAGRHHGRRASAGWDRASRRVDRAADIERVDNCIQCASGFSRERRGRKSSPAWWAPGHSQSGAIPAAGAPSKFRMNHLPPQHRLAAVSGLVDAIEGRAAGRALLLDPPCRQ